MEKTEIEERVKLIRKEFSSYVEENNFDIINLAKRLGFVVGNARLNDNEDGFIAINPNASLGNLRTNKVIGVNYNRTPEKKRFIIAHELGHYFLNAQQGAKMYAHRERLDKRNDDEENTDYFAACFLMPKDLFLSKYNGFKKEVENKTLDKDAIVRKMANEFGVDEGAVLKRFIELDLRLEVNNE